MPHCWPFFLLLGKIPLCRPKNNPHTSGYFHVNFIPCLFAFLITQSAHREYSSVNDINDIYASIMSCCWFVARFCHKLGECFIYVKSLENIGTWVKITWNYFPCLVLHKVKVFIDYAQGLVQLLLLIFTSMISFLLCLSSWKTAKLLITMVAK